MLDGVLVAASVQADNADAPLDAHHHADLAAFQHAIRAMRSDGAGSTTPARPVGRAMISRHGTPLAGDTSVTPSSERAWVETPSPMLHEAGGLTSPAGSHASRHMFGHVS